MEIRKTLKRNKAVGPDEIPNEIFLEASKETLTTLTQILNIIHMEKHVPEAWRNGIISHLFNGKEKKGKCSNERSITISSNIDTFYKRIIENKARKQVNISEVQAGGREGRATTDHLIIQKERIIAQKRKKKTTFSIS